MDKSQLEASYLILFLIDVRLRKCCECVSVPYCINVIPRTIWQTSILRWAKPVNMSHHIHCGQHLLWLLLVQTYCLIHSLLSASLSHSHVSWQKHRVFYPSQAEYLLLNLWYPKIATARKISSISCSVFNWRKPETTALDDISVFNKSAMERLLQVLFGIDKHLPVPYHNTGVTIQYYSSQFCSELILSTKVHEVHERNINILKDQ